MDGVVGTCEWHLGSDALVWAAQDGRAPTMTALLAQVAPADLAPARKACEAARGGAVATVSVRLQDQPTRPPLALTVLLSPARSGTVRVVLFPPASVADPSAVQRRALVEQAKGVYMARYGITADEAADRLRASSRNDNVAIVDLARSVIGGTRRSDVQDVLGHGSMFRLLDGLVSPALVLRAVRDGDRVSDMVVEHANPAAVDLDGRRAPQLVGRRLLKVYPGVVGSGVWDVYRTVLATGVPYTPERTAYEEDTRAHGRVTGTIR